MEINTVLPTHSKQLLHFSNRSYPRFGRKQYDAENPPRTVLNSPYFWWFKFLQLNKDYLQTTKKNGVGKCAELYKDFGDIRNVDFKVWWQAHAHLFAEAYYSGYKMQVITDYTKLPPLSNTNVITLIVPLDWTQRSIIKEFRKLVLSRVEKTKRGMSVNKSTAKYQISSKWNCFAMENAFKVYVAKLNSKTNVWADIAIEAKINASNGLAVGVKGKATSQQRRVATITAMRYYKRALRYIQASASTTFPKLV